MKIYEKQINSTESTYESQDEMISDGQKAYINYESTLLRKRYVCAIVILGLGLSLLIIIVAVTFSKISIQPKISPDTICGGGCCYFVILDLLKGFDPNDRFKLISEYLWLFQSSGVGALIIFDLKASRGLRRVSFKEELKTFVRKAEKYGIQIYYRSINIGKFSANTEFTEQHKHYFNSRKIQDYLYLNYNNVDTFDAVLDVLMDYCETGIFGIDLIDLPYSLDSYSRFLLDSAILEQLKSRLRELCGRELYMLSLAPMYRHSEDYLRNLDALTAYLNIDFHAVVEENMRISDFINKTVNHPKHLKFPEGPINLYSYSYSGLYDVYDRKNDMKYLSILSFLTFLPGSLLLSPGNEFMHSFNDDFEELLKNVNKTQYHYKFLNRTALLAKIKKIHLTNYDTEFVQVQENENGSVILSRKANNSNKLDTIVFIWNRGTENCVVNFATLTKLQDANFTVIMKNLENSYNGESYINLKPEESVMIKIDKNDI